MSANKETGARRMKKSIYRKARVKEISLQTNKEINIKKRNV